ncbi:hypothetical protein ACB098_05G108300 [Castanea mollissima]
MCLGCFFSSCVWRLFFIFFWIPSTWETVLSTKSDWLQDCFAITSLKSIKGVCLVH